MAILGILNGLSSPSLKRKIHSLHHCGSEETVRNTFSKCGITIGGKKPCDIQVLDSRFYSKFASDPTVSIGETFMLGWWTPNNFPIFFNKLVSDWNQLTHSNRRFPFHVDFESYGLYVTEDWESMDFHDFESVETLLKNFQKPKLQKQYGDNFYRVWQFYLHGIAAGYRLGKIHL